MNEATARIKINNLLEAAGWRFFATQHESCQYPHLGSPCALGGKIFGRA